MKKLIYTLPLLLGLAACTSEDNLTPEPEFTPDYDSYYLTMDMTLAQNTRGENDLDGTANEEAITSLDLYFLDTNNQVLFSKTGMTKDNEFTLEEVTNTEVDKSYKVCIKLDTSTGNTNDFTKTNGLNSLSQKSTIYLYVVCNANENPAADDYTVLSATNTPLNYKFSSVNNLHGVFAANAQSESQGKKMIMTNAKNSSVVSEFTGNFSDAKTLFTYDPTHNGMLLDLTTSSRTVDVERASARLDIKYTISNEVDWLYPITAQSGYTENAFKLKLYSLTVNNINPTSFLTLHSVTGTTTAATGSSLDLYMQSGDNVWVADGGWNTASGYEKGTGIYTSSAELPVSTIKTNSASSSKDNYYPFYYVTENTFPSTESMKAVGATPTNVDFKFVVTNANGTPITKNQANPPLGLTFSDDKLNITLTDGTYQDGIEYTDGVGYCLTYKGIITHTDQGTDAEPGFMRYGIVRNYVYQMSIGTIKSLPDPHERDYYLDLTINVLRWSSRQISFNW